MKSIVYTSLLIVIGLAPIGYFIYNHLSKTDSTSSYVTIQYQPARPREMSPGAEFRVLAVKVIDGYIFRVLLDSNEWIEAHLRTATKDEATCLVIDSLRTATGPSLVLRRKVGEYWIVDLSLTIAGKRTTLMEWLEEKKLLL